MPMLHRVPVVRAVTVAVAICTLPACVAVEKGGSVRTVPGLAGCPVAVSVFDGDPAGDAKVADAVVRVSGPRTQLEGRTDASGNYEARLSAAAHVARVEAAGFEPATVTVRACSQPVVAVSLVRIAVTAVPVSAPAWTPRALNGRIRLQGRAFADDTGPTPALGASFFWLAWGYRHDRERTEANLKWLAQRGVEFVRAFGEVGGAAWSDRTVDPAWPDYVDVIRGATTLANAHGLRVEWTVFGGGASRTDADWRSATRRLIDALRHVTHGVQFVEIQNEEQGPPSALARELAGVVRRELGVAVAVTGTPEKGLPALYAGSSATVATVHFDRQQGDHGWRFARQPWGYWELESMPAAFVNNEPAGINGSVRPENDPVKLASDALVTWVSGGAAYVLHHGAGIYGKPMDHPVGGHRYADVWEQPSLEPALALIARIRGELPPDVSNWTRANNHWTAPNPVPPFRFRMEQLGDAATRDRGITRAFTTQRGTEFVTVLLGVRGDLQSAATRGAEATVFDLKDWQPRPWTGRVVGTDTTFLVRGR